MPQNPIVPRPGGALSALDVSAATVVKNSPGTLVRITVLAVATGGTFGAYDATTTGAAATANAIVQYASGYPAVGSVITLEWPCANGIVINPGTGGAVSVAYA
ncbi:hypothetical protein OHZ10_08135 [Burkholderia arboris]|uniref:Bacteriophage protein n=1 Tax=Burkholderia arboris TaxID=488730 RepID=A0ABZ3DKA9_9BURK